ALDALRIYALKTAPAFEAALYSGLRLAGPTAKYDKMVGEFSKNMGIAFQILNDLKDWEGDSDNKLVAGQDVLAGRPTLLLALALEALQGPDREELLALLHGSHGAPAVGTNGHSNGNANGNGVQAHGWQSVSAPQIQRVRRLFDKAQVFDKADKLVEKFKARAEAIADDVEPTELRELLYYLVDSVLDRRPCPI